MEFKMDEQLEKTLKVNYESAFEDTSGRRGYGRDYFGGKLTIRGENVRRGVYDECVVELSGFVISAHYGESGDVFVYNSPLGKNGRPVPTKEYFIAPVFKDSGYEGFRRYLCYVMAYHEGYK